MKQLLSSFILLCIYSASFAQYPGIAWQKCLGGSNREEGSCIRQTTDSGYIVCGFSYSNDGDVTGNHGHDDVWVVKLNSNGSIIWQKNYGGGSYEEGYSIQQTFDGGYILVGNTWSSDGDVTSNHGNADVWVIKITATGSISWQKTYGGTGTDLGFSMSLTADSGYIIAGITRSTDGDVTGFHGGYEDIWVLKINKTGGLMWQRCLGGSDDDFTYNNQVVQQTKDGGYIVAGSTKSNDGDVTSYHGGLGDDAWIIKLNDTGGISWQKTYGGTDPDEANTILQLNDSSYLFGGGSTSTDGDVTGFHGGGSYDMWVVKITPTGSITWQKCLGGLGDDMANSVLRTAGGDYMLCGYTSSTDGDVSHQNGAYDVWAVKLNATGNLIAEAALGGDSDELGYSIRQTFDNGYILSGYAISNNGDVSGKHGGTDGTEDMWAVKLNQNLKVESLNATNNNVIVYPNPTKDVLHIELPVHFENAELIIYDMLGRSRTFISSGIKRNIDMHDYAPGVYTIQIRDNDNIQNIKFLYQP